jgi:signal transduction histidine kinase
MPLARRHVLAVLALSAAAFALPAAAQERGTRDDAKALNDAAVAHIKKVGLDQAAKDFGSDKAKWAPKDIFPFVQEFSGVMRFHINDKMIGKNFLEVKDASGKEFAKEMISVARSAKSAGWVEYEWTHQVTKKIEDKTSYIQRVPGMDAFVGVGIYR